MFEEVKANLDKAIEFINNQEYKKARSVVAYVKFRLGEIEVAQQRVPMTALPICSNCGLKIQQAE